MSPDSIKYIIVGIVAITFVGETILSWLNHKAFRREMPPGAGLFYNADEYERAYQYNLVTYRFGLVTGTISTIVLLIILLTGAFSLADRAAASVTDNRIFQSVLFFGIIGFVSDIARIPFSLYSTFVIEERFGFNKTTVRTWILDKIKGYLLAVVLGGGILALITWIYYSFGSGFWIIAFLVTALVSVFTSLFYTSLFLPLFNKLIPLPESPLRDAIINYCKKVGFRLEHIFQMDGSKRSSRGNAFFSGLGPRKSIVLFDTLINNHPQEELVAVLAHEVGHYKLKHTGKSMVTGLFQTFLMFLVMGFVLSDERLSLALGASDHSFHMAILAFGLLFTPVSLVTGILRNYTSRKHEFEADQFAAQTYSGPELANALQRLGTDNLVNLTPHPAYTFVYYSHPPILQRIGRLKDQKQSTTFS